MTDIDRVRVTRVIDAPRHEVFRAWTDPEILKAWWGPGAFTCPEAEVDLRPGGDYRLVMQPTSGEPMVLAGTYREVDAPSRLVYTWRWATGPAATGDESLVTVEFVDAGDRTEVRLSHEDFPPDHGPAPYALGWDGGLEKLEALLTGPAEVL